MSVTNPAPAQISDGNWSVEAGIRSFTVSIPTKPADNDLSGIIVLAKAGTGQTLTFPDDVFYQGAWSDLIVVNTDAANSVLLPNQAYTFKVASFDEFGTDSLTFSNAKEVTTLQIVEDDIEADAVTTTKIENLAVQTVKIADEAVSIVSRSNDFDFANYNPTFTFTYDMPSDGDVVFIAIIYPQGNASLTSEFLTEFYADGSATRFDYIKDIGYIAPANKVLSSKGTRAQGNGYSISVECTLTNITPNADGDYGARVDFILIRRFK